MYSPKKSRALPPQTMIGRRSSYAFMWMPTR